MKVLYVAAECKPFSKVGGVGDVAGELPIALKRLGVDVEIVTPGYGRQGAPFDEVPFQGRREVVGLLSEDLRGVPVTLVTNDTYFGTDYSTGSHPAPFKNPELFQKDYRKPYVDSDTVPFYDDALRFSFFSQACLGLVARKQPDIVHVNDWPLGYLLGRLAMSRARQKRILTIHNIGYQGNLWRPSIQDWNIEQIAVDSEVGPLFDDPRPEWNSVNPLRLAMELAHKTNTVSPHYKTEMTQPEDPSRFFEGGKGLDPVAAKLNAQGRLFGILNGFEYTVEPSDATFESTLVKKAEMKRVLGKEFANPEAFLLGFVGRAVEQKFRLLAETLDGKSVLEHILDIPGVNVAFVATGQPKYETLMRRFLGRRNYSVLVDFDKTRAREISLGSDVFLMPSVFEPCGITQMESMSCATPPLVRWTGGLVDTVTPHTDPNGTGFGFDGASARAVLRNLIASVREALEMFTARPQEFRDLQRRAFNRRFLWSTAAQRYVSDLYGA